MPAESGLPGHYVIWLQIVEHLHEEKYLSRVSLCCRQLHSIAARQRWRRIAIEATRRRIESFRLLLKAGTAPTGYIQHINLRGNHDERIAELLSGLFRTLARNLQSDTLRSFTYVQRFLCVAPNAHC
jgi:hypothetical protein